MRYSKIFIISFFTLIFTFQFVFAISNVQHSVDGNKVTLTYQGTPPFLINIRGDTNIGQAGGYLLATTYQNTFTYDMSFAINPSKKFYYGLKDNAWSNTYNFLIDQQVLPEDVFVIQDFSYQTSHDPNLIYNITNEFYKKNSDKYDFIYIISEYSPYGNAGFFKTQNQGENNFLLYNFFPFNNTKIYGSKGNLKGLVIDGTKKIYLEGENTIDPTWYINRFYFGTIQHELMHNFGIFLPHELKNASSKDYYGNYYYDGHWEKYVGSWLSVGGDTQAKLTQLNEKYYLNYNCISEPKNNDFELYAMGLKPIQEITDKIIVLKSNIPIETELNPFSSCNKITEIPKEYITNSYTIQDFIKVIGENKNSGKTNYNVAFIFLTSNASKITEKDINSLKWISAKFPITWYKSSDKKSTINSITPSDQTPPIISNVVKKLNSTSITIEWKTNELSTTSLVYTNTQFNYIKIAPNLVVFPPSLRLSHQIILTSKDDPNIGYYGTNNYELKIVSVDENLNLAFYDVN
jgi:hypothetical protein